MSSTPPKRWITLRGVRQNNLKNFDLDLPMNRLIVISGLSGSGKSSLAFDTLYAEGQRRYIETFSPYARQFFDRMDKPRVDRIEGIPPAIAIEQKNTVRTTRSTVGTMTEICDYMKVLWSHLARPECPQCHRVVGKNRPPDIWKTIKQTCETGDEILITFNLKISGKISMIEILSLVEKQGYQRVWLNDQVMRLNESSSILKNSKTESITIIQDIIKMSPRVRARFLE
jgi:excinuclease ABC subunit A